MTRQRSFKRLIRARMAKTGESYTAARQKLLAATSDSTTGEKPWLATTDEKIRDRTGLGWEQWFDLLDEAGGQELAHRDIGRWVAAKLDIEPLAWNAQAITASYERTRGLREAGQHEDGFAITASRTVAVPGERLYDAITDPAQRAAWLPNDLLRERKATPAKSAHFDWGDDGSRVHVHVTPKGEDRSVVSLQHARLADVQARDRTKEFWRGRLVALKAALEGGEHDG